jgi:hypothetical protein
MAEKINLADVTEPLSDRSTAASRQRDGFTEILNAEEAL